jgi:Protein of unknown function (DUF1194)
MIARALLALMASAGLAAAEGRTPVAIELVLAIDSSASVDWGEFQLQLEGVAAAFADPEVLEAVENLRPLGVAVGVVQWGGSGDTRVVVPFTHIETPRGAKAFGYLASRVQRWHRASETSIGTAIADSAALLAANGFDGHRLVIDVSGDGPDNSQVDLAQTRAAARAQRIVINGLPIEAEESGLTQYYSERVIAGPGSFVETANGFDDFARAFKEKLLRELRPLES